MSTIDEFMAWTPPAQPDPTDEQQHILDLFNTGASFKVEAGAGTGKTTTLGMVARSTTRRGLYIAFNKALRWDQPVATPHGWVPIGKLEVGDLVFGVDGRPHPVVKVIDRGRRPMNTVRFSDGTEVIADDEHLWAIERTHTANTTYVHAEVATTTAISEHLALDRGVRVPTAAPLELPNVDLPVDPWLLGALLGDGSLNHGRIWFTSADEWMIDQVTALIPTGCEVRPVGSTHLRSARTVAIVGDGRSNPLLDQLRTIGAYGAACSAKAVPERYLWASPAQRLAVLQGLMDTDGSAGAASVTPIFTSTSAALADAVVFLTQSLGGTATKRTMRDAVGPWATAYQVTVRLPEPFEPFRSPARRDRLRARTHDRLLRRRIVSVEPGPPARAVCISIDTDDHLFLTAGLVPTHNSIVTEAGSKMPGNVRARTAHSLAYQAIGGDYRHRLDAPRMRSSDIAKLLGIRSLRIEVPGHARMLAPWRIAGIVMRTIAQFCQSADDTITVDHVPHQEGIDWPGSHRAGQQQLAEHIVPYARTAWADLTSLDGQLPFKHEHYLKLWQLDRPRLDVDFILFDEAQDANPVMAAVVADQADHAQLGWIGDSQQQIYSWNGAINALDGISADHTAYLTQSWRFGDTIAEAANQVLGALGAKLRLTGLPNAHGWLGHVIDDDVDCVLTRTNARAMVEVIAQTERGRIPHVVGGGREIIDFARGAQQLQDGGKAGHPDLACFDSWMEVLEYVATDELGSELALMTDLVKRFGGRRLQAILLGLPGDEKQADVVISTAHKAKGREWDHVRLAEDLDVERDDEVGLPREEMRLLYVAVTRAREALDPTTVQLAWPWLEELHADQH